MSRDPSPSPPSPPETPPDAAAAPPGGGPTPLVILGPTAGGKSELAVRLAQRLDGEILGADAFQIYRELDAGTAKPAPADRRRVRHHLVDVVDPTDAFTVADWLEAADRVIGDLRSRGRPPIVVGGTNLYIRALLEGLFEGPPGDPALRARLDAVPGHELHAALAKLDPAAADRIHVNDRKKLIRAIEVCELTGRPMSRQQTQWTETPTARAAGGAGSSYRHGAVLVGLAWPVAALNRRINRRVRVMFDPSRAEAVYGVPWSRISGTDQSLPEETRRLEQAGRLGPQAREALGTKQVLAALRGELSLDEAMERTKILTRRFAKTQRTWLKRFRGVRWLDAAPVADGSEESDRALDRWAAEAAAWWADSQP